MSNGFSKLELQVLAEMGVGPNDPAARAMLNRIAEIKDLEVAGDPAFQPRSRYFESRHGAGAERALGLFGDQPSGEDDLIKLLEMVLEQQGADGGYGRVPVWQQLAAEEAESTAAYRRALQTMGLEQEFERKMLGLERGFERSELERGSEREREEARRGMEHEARLTGMTQAERKAQREREMKQAGQASTIDIFGRDPAQSVLFALGTMGGGYGEMPPL